MHARRKAGETAGFADLVLERNAPDAALYDWVAANPRIPVLEQKSEQVSPFTILMYELEKQTHTGAHAVLFQTDDVVAALRQNPELVNDMKTLSDVVLNGNTPEA